MIFFKEAVALTKPENIHNIIQGVLTNADIDTFDDILWDLDELGLNPYDYVFSIINNRPNFVWRGFNKVTYDLPEDQYEQIEFENDEISEIEISDDYLSYMHSEVDQWYKLSKGKVVRCNEDGTLF